MDETLVSILSGRRWQWWQIALVALFVPIVLGLAGCGPSSQAPAASAAHLAGNEARGPLALSTDQLAWAFKQDEAAAQVKYGGRQLHVTGMVQEVVLENINAPTLRLSHDVLAILTEKQAAASLIKGRIITVVCADVAKTPSGPTLKNCVVKHSPFLGT